MRAKLRLGETVETIMSRPPIVIGAGASVQEAARLMAVNRVGSVMVVDDEGRLVGIVTERDIVRLVAFSGADLSRDYPIARVMSSDPVTLGPRENLLDALAKMCENNVRHL
ncbi:MAG: CBS domain-containing protein, partial [Fervidicoccaceae archaeon]